VIGEARVRARVRRVAPAPAFAGVEYPHLVELEIERLAPLRGGVELAPLVPRLAVTFPNAASWRVRMRRALVPLAAEDAAMIARELRAVARSYPEARRTYMEGGA
jgi:hypothetical protein